MAVIITTTITTMTLILLLHLTTPSHQNPQTPLPYLSPSTLFPNYQTMIHTLKIFIYTPKPQTPLSLTSPSLSLFYASLSNSQFVTLAPNQAHLFLLPFSSDLSTRSISRLIRDLRAELPFWNRTLGADHVYLSCDGLGYESDRNLVELKKNSVQVSCFADSNGKFIPHKDVTLPPLNTNHRVLESSASSRSVLVSVNTSAVYLGYLRFSGGIDSRFVNALSNDHEFLVESAPFDEKSHVVNDMMKSRFCLFTYGGDVTWIGEALSVGCVPVVITDRPINDLPLMDVVRWSEIALFVGSGGEVKDLKSVLLGITCGDRYKKMRDSGVVASKHFVWNEKPQPYDAFHMVMYQLWLRRHTIRYARWEAS